MTVDVLKAIEQSVLIDLIGRDNISAHVDAGKTGDSRKVLESCVGWVKSLGYMTMHKPYSFVASHVADRFVH